MEKVLKLKKIEGPKKFLKKWEKNKKIDISKR